MATLFKDMMGTTPESIQQESTLRRTKQSRQSSTTTYPGAVDPVIAGGAKFNQTSEPFYPSPWMNPHTGGWEEAYVKAKDFVSQLTLLEKVNLTTGVGWEGEACVGNVGSIPRLGLKSLCMQDSPVGVRFSDFNSVFSSGQSVAATFDRGLMYARGYAMAQEHKAKGVTVQLGPVAGPLGRAPQGGRNWEGFSPDPVLTGVGIAETIKGIQDAGIIACAKHFIGNEQEHFRQAPEAVGFGYNITESISSNIDDVTMHETYLWPFADAVRAGVGSIMCSYNQVNNSYACQNSKMLNNLLKGELGFQGFVMSDWQAQHSGAASAVAGLDMTMPGDTLFNTGESFWGANLTLAVINGTVPEWRIDDMAMRIMAAYFKVGLTLDQPEPNFSSWTLDTYGPSHYAANKDYKQVNWHVDVRGDHAKLIRDIGARSTVLLKNIKNALPLSKPKFLAVIGEDAGGNAYGPNGCPDRGCDNGTLGMAWGSGSSNFPYLIEALVSQEVTAIVFVNANSGEGYINVDGNEGDRNNLTLWHSGDELIQNVSALCNNTIVVIHSTGPTLVGDWYDNENVTAILWAGVPGQESGNSITDVLYGKVNPAARTPFTWGPTRESYGTDVLYEPNNGELAPQDDFTEGNFIDYRAFDAQNITPIYEFGFGLSYTTFNYSNLVVTKNTNASNTYTPSTGTTEAASNFRKLLYKSRRLCLPQWIIPLRLPIHLPLPQHQRRRRLIRRSPLRTKTPRSSSHPRRPMALPNPSTQQVVPPVENPALYDVLYTVTAQIHNSGSINGEEVPQLYLSLGGPNDPLTVLRGFERLSIDAGSSATFTVDLTRRDFEQLGHGRPKLVHQQSYQDRLRRC
ncbi:hypothetical protein EYC84_007708 [Monilinia fructicola]|uniref:beta-glucosidase n=1 Tax=Monilinia fructicola TaxID=38448 RepID=A0A5M9JGN0_MONFR|nr:hypothetical protein EYC84_007708 [Monilinia fructicola]